MPGYTTRDLRLSIGGQSLLIRALSDRQQFADPHGLARQAGISSAQWSLFGQVWPAGERLAELMCDYPVGGKRVLEIGCGLGLSSLILKRRRADITASDHHPLAGVLLAHNARANQLAPIPYCDLPWGGRNTTLGRFDLIVGSDILYERGQADLLAGLVARHAEDGCEIVITDPGRGNSAEFSRALALQGFTLASRAATGAASDGSPSRGHLLAYLRDAEPSKRASRSAS
jgi:predicted nicotinamide N-methyase